MSPCSSGSPSFSKIPYLPDVKESLLYQPNALQSPKLPSWTAYLHEKSSKRHVPYPLRPSPLELWFANCVTGQVCQPDFTPEQLQEHEDTISSGLSQMSFDTLYKAFKAVLANREATCHEVVTSLLQVEYSQCMTAFSEALHQENKDCLYLKDEQPKKIRNLFSEHDRTEIDDNKNYLQAIYNDECEMLRAITTQAEVISKRLGSRAKHDLLASTGEAPYLPHFINTLNDRDSITHALCNGFTDASTDTNSNSDFGKEEDNGRPGQHRLCSMC
ncbi:hypothetical protein BDR07DRAFT_1482870 [Suillus spraguei]|nr:hypothetical protein BDR07DRAFT_1482870 [Suillus spraguei]